MTLYASRLADHCHPCRNGDHEDCHVGGDDRWGEWRSCGCDCEPEPVECGACYGSGRGQITVRGNVADITCAYCFGEGAVEPCDD